MVIHRVGPLPDTAPTRQELGRVLVTIDDLEALMVIMRQEATDPDSVQVQFSGGYFTDAEDIRQLSDDEVSSLKVHSDNAEVNLDQLQAIAIGSPVVASKIVNTWSRSRQTSIGATKLALRPIIAITIAILIFAIVGFVAYQLFGRGSIFISSTNAFGSAILIFSLVWLIGGLIAAFMMSRSQVRSQGGAVIRPMSIHEFRQLRNNNQYPRAAWIVAIIAVIVAVVAIIVPVLTAKP